MRLLLDTHAFLWFSADDQKLSSKARALVEDAANEKILSAASAWEVAIKQSIGKLQIFSPVFALFDQALKEPDWTWLSMDLQHISEVSALPLHHRDPFDRMLASQALIQEIPIVSCDEHFDAYSVDRYW